MENKEMIDMKASLINSELQRTSSFRMYNKSQRVKPTKVNSDLTVVCTKVNVTISPENGNEAESPGDIIILKLSELSFNK